MAQKVAVVTPRGEVDTTLIEQALEGVDYELEVHVCKSPGETIEAVKGSEVIISQGVPFPREVIEEIDTAKAILTPSHGFNHIDHEAATEKGIMVVNAAGFCSEEVSNHAIVLLLACAKKLTMLDSYVKAGKWGAGTRMELLPMVPIDGQTIGLVGLGNIGRATARKAQAFGMNVITYDPYVPPWIVKEYRVERVGTLAELARRSDFVSMHVPLNKETEKLVGESFFRAMKPTAYFINTCRGRTVDEKALIKALQEGWIAGAGLDVFEQEPTPPNNPLLKMDNVIVTPHSAGTSNASRIAAQVRAGQETARILKGHWPMSLVNPEVRANLPMRPAALNV
jgi:D-3-phosphoglycerate dehydrogenase